MDVLDRYLNAIRWNLPRAAKADDVIAELRDVIASRIEEREDRLDRALTPDEVSGVLRDFGHPLVVAARYGTQQWLVGPEIFPFYLFSLKVVLAISALIVVVSGVGGLLSGGLPSFGHALHGAFWTLLSHAGLVTLIFAIIERTGWLTEYLKTWKPESLPELPDFAAKPKSAWESVFEVAVGIGVILWWAGLIHVPILYIGAKGLDLALDPVWMALWWPIFVLLVARLVFNVVQWLRPSWQTARAALSVVTAAGGIALLAILYRAQHLVIASSTTLPADRVAHIDHSLNVGLHYAALGIGVLWAFQCGQELWRLYVARR